MFSHRALYLETIHLISLGVLSNDPEREQIGETGVALLNIPLFHIHAWGAPFMAVFAATTLVLPGAFTVEGFCELVQNEKVTTSQFVPTMLAMIIEYPDIDKYDLSSLRGVHRRRRRSAAGPKDEGREDDPTSGRLQATA